MPVAPMSKKVPCECRRGRVCEECRRRQRCEWRWDGEGAGATVVFHNDDRDVIFNPGFSVGTAAVKGKTPFQRGCHHFWEIEMSTEVYGTDMMIGVGTEKTDLRKYSHNFVSLLGMDDQSWGLSYTGERKNNGQSYPYSRPFGQNSIIGVHLDLWAGTIEFYLDRKPLGLAFKGLQNKVLYPMISSTAARSGMNLIFSRSYPASLQMQTMLSLRQYLSPPPTAEVEAPSLFNVLTLPPGMKLWMKNNYWWIVSCRDRDRKREEELNNRVKSDKIFRRLRRGVCMGSSNFNGSGGRRGGRANATEGDDPYFIYGDGDEDTESEPEYNDEDEEDDDDEVAGTDESPRQPSSSRRRRAQRQHCTATQSTGENCMRLLAATNSRTHFLGRVSPIFVGMPEGGFSILSSISGVGSTSSQHTPRSSPAYGNPRPVTRSRSVPAQPTSSAAMAGSSSGAVSISKVPIARQPSYTSEEDEDSIAHSSRREPKRLRLRSSIEVKGNGEEDATEGKGEGEEDESEDKYNAIIL